MAGLTMITDENVMSDSEKNFVNKNIVKNRFFPMFYSNSTSTLFPFFSHVLLERNNPNDVEQLKPRSDLYNFFYPIFQRFCERNKIEHTRILRASINATYNICGYEVSDPHVDYSDVQHGVFILYLNDLEFDEEYNSTIIYRKQYDKEIGSRILVSEYGIDYVKQLPIATTIEPKMGKAICFSGEYYHTLKFPKPSETRYVCVFNFI